MLRTTRRRLLFRLGGAASPARQRPGTPASSAPVRAAHPLASPPPPRGGDPSPPGRTGRRHDDQWGRRVRRLDNRGMELRGRGARRAQHDRRLAGDLAEPDREERARSLVDLDDHLYLRVTLERHRDGGRARAGRYACVLDALSCELIDERSAKCLLYIHRICHGRFCPPPTCASTISSPAKALRSPCCTVSRRAAGAGRRSSQTCPRVGAGWCRTCAATAKP